MIPTKPTTNARAILHGLSLALLCGAGSLAYGQTAVTNPATSANPPASAPATLNEDQAVELPKFEITAESGNRYQSQQALSASRIATPIVDIPQTISVIPKELMEDTKGNRMLDTAKYVTPVQESTLPFGGDRYSIRGFMVSAEFIDGTMISGADGYSMSQAPYNIERLEVIKGPNSILVPGGSPGGVINPITKAPMAKNAASVTIDYSPNMGRDVWFDVNRVLTKDGKMAARLVAAYWNSEFYIKDHFRKGYEISPSFSYQISPASKLTVKADVVLNRETNLGGLPIDPSIGYGGVAQIARGLPRDWQFGNDIDSRKRTTQRLSAELISELSQNVSSRLMFMVDHVHRHDVGGTAAGLTQAGGGSVNPLTGEYEPGVSWNTAAYNADTSGTVVLTGTSVPVTDPSTWVYTRNNGKVDLDYMEAHLKNDYAAKFGGRNFKSTTIAGLTANVSRVRFQSWKSYRRSDVAASNLAGIVYEPYNFDPIKPGTSTQGLGTDKTGVLKDLQAFVYDTLSIWEDRIQVSGGVSRYFGELTRDDTNGTVSFTIPNPGYHPTNNPTAPQTLTNPAFNTTSNATSFGIVVKPIKQISLFFSRNTTGAAMPGSLQAGNTTPGMPLAVGSQKEYGFKTNFLDGRLTTSFAYFDIAQQNVATTNSEYYRLLSLGDPASIAAANALTPLYLDLTSKGWEFEATYAMRKGLTIVGNVTDYKVRQPITNTRVRGMPDLAYGGYVDYKFVDGALKNFGINFGIDYKGDVAGENATGFIVARGHAPMPVKPSFVVGARTLANLGFSYKIAHWAASVTIMNLTDKEYILAAGSRGSLVVGTPRTFKSTISYTF